MVRVLYFAMIREYTRCPEECVRAETLGAVLDHIAAAYGEDARSAVLSGMLTLDGALLGRPDPALPLPDGSEIGAFGFCCGG